jgi:hypothetical protein
MRNIDKINEIHNILVYDKALKQMPKNSKLIINGVVLASEKLSELEIDNYKKECKNILKLK